MSLLDDIGILIKRGTLYSASVCTISGTVISPWHSCETPCWDNYPFRGSLLPWKFPLGAPSYSRSSFLPVVICWHHSYPKQRIDFGPGPGKWRRDRESHPVKYGGGSLPFAIYFFFSILAMVRCRKWRKKFVIFAIYFRHFAVDYLAIFAIMANIFRHYFFLFLPFSPSFFSPFSPLLRR